MQQVVTLVEYSVPKTGTSQHGAWSLHVFKDAGGNRYQTFKDDLANLGRTLINQPVTVTYEVEQSTKPGADGTPQTFTNNKLTSIEAAYGQQPVAQQPQQPQPALPQQPAQAPPVPQRAVSGNRAQSAADTNRARAIEYTIELIKLGLITGLTDPHQVIAAADTVFVSYLESGSSGATSAVPSHGDPGVAVDMAATHGPQY